MKTHLINKLRHSVNYFLGFSNVNVPLPEVAVRNSDNEEVRGIAIENAITGDLKSSNTTIVANESIFPKEDYEAWLCHELGHLVKLVKNPSMPSNRFMYILKDELQADQEGLRMYLLAGRNKWDFYSNFKGNFSELFERISSDRSIRLLWKHIKSLIINEIRIVFFIFYRRPKRGGKLAKGSNFCYNKGS